MKPQRWKEIDGIFALALELEPARRAQFLDKACGEDEQLRKEVESLLAEDSPESLVGMQAVEEATRLLMPDRGQALQNKNIGPYQILRELGAGGMGRVYLAQDKRLNRPVAVKLLSFYDAAAEERIQRFRQEALAASALNHPNILTIYEIGEFESHNFIATEYVDGETLLKRIEDGSISGETAVDIAIQIASALAAAHAVGIVHRDIKPANIMVRVDGLVKVLDFGIAKYSQQDGETPAKDALFETNPGTVLGTAAYMSPEQARGYPTDPRSDIWSLGVVLYEMVTGRRPFQGDTAADVMSAVIGRDPASFSETGLVLPESLEQIVLKTLRKDREARYKSAAELLTDLKQLKRKLGHTVDNQQEALQSSASQTGTSDSLSQARTGGARPANTVEEGGSSQSSAEYVVGRIKSHRLAVLGVLIILMSAAGYVAYRSLFSNKSQPIDSIAVMPFTNDSGDGEVEYLSDGMTETLINSLSQLPNLSVKARSSVFRYKGKEVDPQRVAAELSVQAILTGRVVQRGEDLTLYLSLVDARNGNQIWGEQYNRKLKDLVVLQQEIARDVSSKLRLKLSGPEVQKLAKNYTENVEAYQLYLKGRYHLFKLTPPEMQTGISYFQQAIQNDPSYALAYVGLANAYRALVLSADFPSREFFPKAKMAAQKAVEIDDTFAEAHAVLGYTIFWYDWDWKEAESQFKRALDLNPNSADSHWFYSGVLSVTGRHAEAIAEIKRARELDPLSALISANEGLVLTLAGQTDQALETFQKTFEIAPNFWFVHMFASKTYIDKGMYPEAIAEALKAREFSASSQPTVYLGYALANSGKQAEARKLLEELLKLSAERNVPPTHIAMFYNGLGERDKALEWLERGFEQRDPKMVFMKVDPKWNNLRNDPRFADLIRRLRLN